LGLTWDAIPGSSLFFKQGQNGLPVFSQTSFHFNATNNFEVRDMGLIIPLLSRRLGVNRECNVGSRKCRQELALRQVARGNYGAAMIKPSVR